MPVKALPSQEKFRLFEEYMEKEGFRKLTKPESSRSFERLGLRAQRPRAGRETGFVFTANGLTIYVWTTFLEQEGRAREEDSGWVVITEGDTPVYFSHPMMRTEGFLRRLFRNAQIAKERVLNRPTCPSCRAYMQVVQGRHLKQKYWKCAGKSRFHKPQTLPWDYGLSEESVIYLNAQRKNRKRYRESLKELNRVVAPAVLNRRAWQTTRPQNRT